MPGGSADLDSTGKKRCQRDPQQSAGSRQRSVRPELFADTVDEELDAPALGTDVDVEVFPLHEQLAELTEDAPIRALVETLATDIVQRSLAPGTGDRIRDRRGIRHGLEPGILETRVARSALPADSKTVVDGLAALAACPHMSEGYEGVPNFVQSGGTGALTWIGISRLTTRSAAAFERACTRSA